MIIYPTDKVPRLCEETQSFKAHSEPFLDKFIKIVQKYRNGIIVILYSSKKLQYDRPITCVQQSNNFMFDAFNISADNVYNNIIIIIIIIELL